MQPWTFPPLRPLMATVLVAIVTLAACGGKGNDPVPEPALNAQQARGKQLAVAKACAGCHTFDGRESAGPTWNGAFGSQVTLTDGTKVTVDEAYLVQSIKDPWSQKVKGYTTIMPRNSLNDDEVKAIVSYIEALGRPAK